MEQTGLERTCEVCGDPLPLETEETMCDSCLDAVEVQVAEIDEEMGCETPASAVDESSSAMPAETVPAVKDSTSGSFDALDAISDMESVSLDSETLTSTPESTPTPTEQKPKEKPTLPCEACGTLQTTLNKFKHPAARESIDLCDKCFAAETALVNHTDDAMQGKIVHPDEADREEIITMDDEDRILYNDAVQLAVSSPIEEVYARISLLENKLQRAKMQLKATRTTLFVRIEHMKKDEREAEYRRLNERDAKRRRSKSPVAADGSGAAPTRKTTSRAPKRSKAQMFRDSMLANGFSEEWIAEQIKKRGIE